LVNFNVAQGQGCCGGNPNARQQCIVAEVDHIAAAEMNSVAVWKPEARERVRMDLGGARPSHRVKASPGAAARHASFSAAARAAMIQF
jgi:hypothetical protein